MEIKTHTINNYKKVGELRSCPSSYDAAVELGGMLSCLLAMPVSLERKTAIMAFMAFMVIVLTVIERSS